MYKKALICLLSLVSLHMVANSTALAQSENTSEVAPLSPLSAADSATRQKPIMHDLNLLAHESTKPETPRPLTVSPQTPSTESQKTSGNLRIMIGEGIRFIGTLAGSLSLISALHALYDDLSR